MSDSTTEQALSWPLLERFVSQPLDNIPGEHLALAVASVFPFQWNELAPEQRESVIKQSDCHKDPEWNIAFQADFHGFDELAKKAGITAAETAEAILTESRLGYSVDSLARMLNTVEELNAGRDVFHPLEEWLRRAQAQRIAYLPSLDWVVKQSNQAAAAQSATAHSGVLESDKPPATTKPPPDWIERARTFALKFIENHRAQNLFPGQRDVCNHIEEKLRDEKVYGPHNKPLAAGYIQRNAIQGKWWQANKP